jgi:hypothetical protein
MSKLTQIGEVTQPGRRNIYFRPDGSLSLSRPKAQGSPDQYAYPGPAPGSENGIVFGQQNLLI